MRILIADDDRTTQRKLQVTIQKLGYEPIIASDGTEALEILESADAPRLVILDWEMPGYNGVELCRRIRAIGDEPYTYVILLTGRGQLEDVIEAMDAGADGFIRKPVEMAELKARLRPGLRMLDLQRQVIQAREDFKFQAQHDALTRLKNRRAIMEDLKHAMHGSDPVSVLMVDIDFFKRINDTYGHDAGDAVLVETAQRLQAAVRGNDQVGRLGGEEFLVVLPRCEAEDVMYVADRIRRSIATTPIATPTGLVTVTASLGAATRSIETSQDALIKQADLALYQAKHSGRNQVVLNNREPLCALVA
jgi:diguanylate cyclase (GGDEF)-like protein